MAKNMTEPCPWKIEVEADTKLREYHDFSDHDTCAELDAKNRSMARKMKKKQEVQQKRQEERERKKQELEESERAKKQAQVAVKQFIQSCLLELSTPQDKLLNEKRNKLSLSAQHYFDKYIEVLREEKERRNRWKIEKEIVEAVEAYHMEVDNTIKELFNTHY
jgi:hypothetical protein